MTEAAPLHSDWRCVSATPWLTPAGARRGLTGFLGRTWQLPSWIPPSSGRHALSPLLPPSPALVGLVRALHGRLLVVNLLPVAAYPREARALVRGLVAAALDGLPPEPWPSAPRDGSAAWPADSRAAYAAVLAHAWLRQHDPAHRLGRADAVAVALYEGPAQISTVTAGLGPEHASDVRARIASRLPPRTLDLPRVVAVVPYRVVVVATSGAASGHRDLLHDAVPEALATGATLGDTTGGGAWLSGSVLLPDPVVVAAMDAASRQRWAACTGRAGRQDTYWYPESWGRFLEPGRTLGCVSAASVARSQPSARRATRPSLTSLDRVVERGVCVPPGYALVDCVGTLGTNAVAI